ncbi:hypothetical protein E2C01_090621 [Portunus trituberculatus]|uniref:Uncharacterized protein n=1 Tax=Portunus trituberculatus TaxID=210409 RepID=A0A5B7JBU0_PORTR|nr:hypothetical protein [Portunus trituberculatus]
MKGWQRGGVSVAAYLIRPFPRQARRALPTAINRTTAARERHTPIDVSAGWRRPDMLSWWQGCGGDETVQGCYSLRGAVGVAKGLRW